MEMDFYPGLGFERGRVPGLRSGKEKLKPEVVTVG